MPITDELMWPVALLVELEGLLVGPPCCNMIKWVPFVM